jgi:DNA adenine methylase
MIPIGYRQRQAQGQPLMTKIKPFLKWAGSKFRCLDNLLPSLSNASRLVEPFTGSAAVFLNANFTDYLLGEANMDLISLFQCLQNEGGLFISYCEQFFTPTNNDAEKYYYLRDQFNHCTDIRQKAALFLYLNRHGYNGLCRYNSAGIYNVPFGRYIKPYFPRMEMEFFAVKSRQAKFIHSDFSSTMQLATLGDLIYCDPPYAPLQQVSNFTSYTHNKFGETEQIILAELAMECAGRGVEVLISNHDTPFTRHHYRYGEIYSFTVSRTINCKRNKRLPAKELLAIFRPSRFI